MTEEPLMPKARLEIASQILASMLSGREDSASFAPRDVRDRANHALTQSDALISLHLTGVWDPKS